MCSATSSCRCWCCQRCRRPHSETDALQRALCERYARYGTRWPVPAYRSGGPLFRRPLHTYGYSTCVFLQSTNACHDFSTPSTLLLPLLSILRGQPRRLHPADLPLASGLSAPTAAAAPWATANSTPPEDASAAPHRCIRKLEYPNSLSVWRPCSTVGHHGRHTHQLCKCCMTRLSWSFLSFCLRLWAGDRWHALLASTQHLSISCLASLPILDQLRPSSRSTLTSETPILARLQVRLEFPNVFFLASRAWLRKRSGSRHLITHQ